MKTQDLKKKKLQLAKQVIRTLSADELKRPAGGIIPMQTADGPGCTVVTYCLFGVCP